MKETSNSAHGGSVQLPVLDPKAGGIDVGSEKMFVSIGGQEPTVFGTCQADLVQMRDYLLVQGVKSVVMEATGVYWICAYEILEEAALKVLVVNGAHVKNLPGRKSDMKDAPWLSQLHAHGLLRGGFVPPEEIRQLRDYVRLRGDWIEMGAAHVQHMQKALERLNLKIHDVISSLTGVSGLRMIRAIVGGERDREKLANMCDGQILHQKRDSLLKALEGNWKAQHLFALGQALQGWDFCQKQLVHCDQEIGKVLEQMARSRPQVAAQEGKNPESDDPAASPGSKPAKTKQKELRHNAPTILGDLHQLLERICGGQDLAALPAINDYTWLQFLSEVGPDLSAWPTEKHFTAWLGLAPGTAQSGKRRRREKRYGGRAGQILRVAARSMARGKQSWLGSFYRRLAATRGPKTANKATARKLAQLIYWTLTKGLAYVEQGIKRYEENYRKQLQKRLERQARRLGMVLLPMDLAPAH